LGKHDGGLVVKKLVILIAAFIAVVSYVPQGGFLSAQILNSESALVSWTPPTQNEDGTTLTDLSHYNLYYDINVTDPTQFTNKVQVGGNLTSFQIDGLTAGTWCFAMTAVNSSELESQFSNVACKTIEELAPEPTRPKAPGALAVE